MSNRPSYRKIAATTARQSPTRAQRKAAPTVIATVAAIAIGLVAVVVVASILVSDDDKKPTTAPVQQFRPVTVDGAALPALPADGTDPAVGTVAPQVLGQSFDGQFAGISADGIPKVVVFVAHWSPESQRQVSTIRQWIAANGAPTSATIELVVTGTDKNKVNYPPYSWLGAGWSIPILVDDEKSSAGTAFSVSSYPQFAVLDLANKVVSRVAGEQTADQLTALVDTAIASTPTTSTTVAPATTVGP
jgi:hypothetical protein